MNGRFFLDTNIFGYSFDPTSPKKAAQASKLIRSPIETRAGIVSHQVARSCQYTNRKDCMERCCGLAPGSSCLGTIRWS